MSESMFQKPLTGLLLLVGAAGAPYIWYETGIGKQVWQSATGGLANGAGSSSETIWNGFQATRMTAGSGFTSGPGAETGGDFWSKAWTKDPFQPGSSSLVQVPVVALSEILRFDITPEWVMSRFPRVTTLLAEMNLDGLRVPLVTGSTPSDLAGTLTYYFDRYKRLQRVSIQAMVGDPGRYILELQQAYQMTQEPSLGGSLYVIKWNGMPTSILYVAPASIVYSDVNYGRYRLFLELNQAGLEYGLSEEARQMIEAGRQTQRW